MGFSGARIRLSTMPTFKSLPGSRSLLIDVARRLSRDRRCTMKKAEDVGAAHTGLVLDKAEFESIKRELASFEEKRELAIATSRDIIHLSKQIIYGIHRGDLEKARGLLPAIRKAIASLPEGKTETDMPEVAKQEYVEAAAYLEFVDHGRLPTRKELDVEFHPYLSGLCDLTGELVRKAVKDVIEHRYEEAKRIHGLVDEIYGAFLQFDLRGGELRKKSDSIRWNLKKLEDVMYDMELKGRLHLAEHEPKEE